MDTTIPSKKGKSHAAAAWMKLEDILASEITESQKDKYC